MFFFNDPATTHIYTYLHTLSLHDALPICSSTVAGSSRRGRPTRFSRIHARTAVLAANATNPAAKLTSVARASLRWGERLDDAAFGDDGTVPAPADDLVQLTAECRQIGELVIDLGQVLAGDRIYGGAGAISLIGQVEQRAHRLNGEAKLTAAADKAQAPQMVGGVAPVIALRPRRSRKQ